MSKEFFGNRFMLRLLIWIVGIFLFSLGLNFVVKAGVGQDTYDVIFWPLKVLIGIPASWYGLGVLFPGGSILIAAAIIIRWKREKSFRVDYALAVIPLIFSGFLIDLIGKLHFFETMGLESDSANVVFSAYPLHILWIVIGIALLYLGIGIFSGARLMPNAYAILVVELSLSFKKSFAKTQLMMDIIFAIFGLLVMVLNASIGRVSDGFSTTWYDVIKVVSLGTAIAISVQGLIVGKVMFAIERMFGYI